MTPTGFRFCPNRTCLVFCGFGLDGLFFDADKQAFHGWGVDVAFQILIRAPCFLRFLQSASIIFSISLDEKSSFSTAGIR